MKTGQDNRGKKKIKDCQNATVNKIREWCILLMLVKELGFY